uniref:Uncharacterized protein n=1 Tax=Arcella intermedia TaxID=1963864 RepID=A0A6B2L8N8_9EUKA
MVGTGVGGGGEGLGMEGGGVGWNLIFGVPLPTPPMPGKLERCPIVAGAFCATGLSGFGATGKAGNSGSTLALVSLEAACCSDLVLEGTGTGDCVCADACSAGLLLEDCSGLSVLGRLSDPLGVCFSSDLVDLAGVSLGDLVWMLVLGVCSVLVDLDGVSFVFGVVVLA